MKKIIQFFKYSLCCTVFVLLCLLLYGFYTVPDSMQRLQDEALSSRSIYTLTYTTAQDTGLAPQMQSRDFDMQVSLFRSIPVKRTRVTVSRRQYAVVSGEVFGLRLYTSGVIIVSTEPVVTEQGEVYPAKDAGLQAGDIIMEIDGEPIYSHTQLTQLFALYGDRPMTVTYERRQQRRQTQFRAAYNEAKRQYMAGLWVRDSAAGIGTMTFYDPQSGVYGCLGHAVCDVDTGEVLPLYNGDIVRASITGCTKGSAGEAGELHGAFTGERVGSLLVNESDGVYGVLDRIPQNPDRVPVALPREVRPGAATLIATVDATGPQSFEIEIEKVMENDAQFRNMIVRITDERLLSITGGIVQGMSGSPILQNGYLVGAVTHVFVNEPKKGYAIFADVMAQKCRAMEAAEQKAAS